MSRLMGEQGLGDGYVTWFILFLDEQSWMFN